MSMIFLDPNMYCFSEAEWGGGDALDRLDRLLTVLEELEESEDRLEVSKGTTFLLPDELLWYSYEVNPNINSPGNGFYHRLFVSKIMPDLSMRRRELALGESCDEVLADHVVINDCVANEALQTFLDSISRTEAQSLVYAFHPQRSSLELGSRCFSDEVAISDVSGAYFVDYGEVFPLEEKRDVACAITESIKILWERLSVRDAAWLGLARTGICVHDDFVPSVSGADFRDRESEYREQIIFTILQIAFGRNLTTKVHSMSPQTVTYKNAKHGKWNAYVFQMGPDATDVRCSRLYFAMIKGGVLLFRYEEDAHP